MSKKIIPAILIMVILLSGPLKARLPSAGVSQSELSALLDSLRKIRSDSARLNLNEVFFHKVYTALSSGVPALVNLDSVNITKAGTEDGRIRIITWNIQQNNGENLYCGFISDQQQLKIFPLNIRKSEPVLDENQVFNSGNWPGGIVYKIIDRKMGNQARYTLLVWDGLNRRESRKYLDVLTFDKQGNPAFGSGIFKTMDGIKNRIVIGYSAGASFTVSYTKQKVVLSGVRKSQRNVNDHMIVFDRLVPMNPELEGQRWSYVPVGNTHDAFIWFNGFWTLTEDIQAKNEASPAPGSKKDKKPEMGLFPRNRD